MASIPPALVDAVREQRAVLFLGAGASRSASHPKGIAVPTGDGLRDLICEKFLGGALKEKPLIAVAAYAANEVGLGAFQKYIHDLFDPFGPAPFHLLIPKFRWRAIATTNFDLILERAYSASPSRLQNLVKTVKDGDNFDVRLNNEANPVGFYKLHGSIEYHTDLSIPLILGNEQYASYEKNRNRFYGRFKDLGFEYPFVFAGYSLSDPHIQRILFDLTDPEVPRPPYYLIAPGISDVEARYWASHRVIVLALAFEEFLNELDKIIPNAARAIPISTGGGELSIRNHYRVVNAIEPPSIVSFLATDVTHVHSGLTDKRQDPVSFYHGNDTGWGCILQNLDARRNFVDSVLVDSILISEENRKTAELFMLKGPAGNGKTISLKRVAWEAAIAYEELAFFVKGPAGLRIEPLAEIFRLTGKRVFLFVDKVASVRHELRDLLQAARARSIPLTVVGAERDNEWNIYCDLLEPLVRQEFPVRYLSESEIDDLLALLERHGALGLLKDLSVDNRKFAFTNRAERQLLVALHEATLGLAFEEIIVDEFRGIEPPVARGLYLDICALHQFGAPVRAGLIARASGVGFEGFQKDFLEPLENIVHVITDDHNKDVYYGARHQHVAEIVFSRVVSSPEEKFDLLARLLTAINVDYTSDRETFSRLIRGRGIAEIFSSVDLGRLFYDRVQEAAPNDAFVLHQRAVFEMHHMGGSLALAEAAAHKAFDLNPNSSSIKHTQAEVARRLANKTDDPLKKIALRRFTREKLGDIASRLSEYDMYTRARLAIDEFLEVSATTELSEGKAPPSGFIEAAREAENSIQQGLQLFPDNPELLAAEATFREHLNQEQRAQRALERAFSSNPRQDWLAVRLARKYRDLGDPTGAKRILDACLKENPSSKVAHLAMGRLLIDAEEDGALEHLRRSFTEGDTHYEGQFWFARELFIKGYPNESAKLFSALNDRAPGRFRTRSAAAIESKNIPILFDCQVKRKEEGYGFVKLVQFPQDVFASRAESDATDWEKLHTGSNAKCVLAFNRRGVRAISVSPS